MGGGGGVLPAAQATEGGVEGKQERGRDRLIFFH